MSSSGFRHADNPHRKACAQEVRNFEVEDQDSKLLFLPLKEPNALKTHSKMVGETLHNFYNFALFALLEQKDVFRLRDELSRRRIAS